MSDTAPTPHIELYVRSMLPDGAHERQEEVIGRLETLDELFATYDPERTVDD